MRRAIAGLVVATAITWAGDPAAAGEPRPLPAFTVVSLADGRPVTSSALPAHERWVLVYVVPDCRPCEHLIRAFKRWRTPALAERAVILIGAVPEDGTAWMRQALPEELQGIRRYADAEGEAWHTLGLEGAPVVLGVQRGRVEWTLSGLPPDPAALASILRSWLGD